MKAPIDSAPPPSRHQNYMPHLDALRAFAVSAVLFEHFAGRELNKLIPIGAGTIGVNLFFTLSGFLITGILLQEFTSVNQPLYVSWRNFYLRRCARLIPIFYLTVFILVVLGIGNFPTAWPWHVAYLSNFYIAQGGEKTVFWSLSVEEQFYLIWPFVIAFAPRKYLLHAVVAVILSALIWKFGSYLIGVRPVVVNTMLPGSLEPLGLGCLIAVLSFKNGRPNQFDWFTGNLRWQFAATAFGSLGLAFLFWRMFGPVSFIRYMTIDLMMAVFYSWLVLRAAIGFGGIVGRICSFGPILYLGKISYGVYVTHNFIPSILEKYLGTYPKYVLGPTTLLIVFVVCHLSWEYVESPVLRWARSFRAQDKKPVEAAPAAASGS